jgi:UDP-glucose 4-epimerase
MQKFNFLNKEKKIKRVLILGSSGIISKNFQSKLQKENIPFLVIGRKKIDLTRKKSIKKLSKLVKKNDVILFLASNAPVKNLSTYIENINICKTVYESIEEKKISQFCYISSDAVYKDSKYKLNESSLAEPSNFHGLMHITREKILNLKFKNKLCILRPTMIYGKHDTHHGYGPNLFLQQINSNKNINIFGKGEERRDHVYINDLTEILLICLKKNARGIVNVASGNIYSFYSIASEIMKNINKKVKIINIKRNGPMPHNGFRPFDVSLLKKKFKTVKLTTFKTGLKKYMRSLEK